MKHIFLGLGASVALALPAHSATLAAFDIPMNRTTLEATETADGVTGVNLSRGPGLKRTGVGTFRATSWTIGGDAETARAQNNYFSWGFTSTTAYDLTSLDIHYDGSNKGPKSIVLDLIVNGGAPVLDVYTDLSVSTTGETHMGIDLSAFDNVTSVLFRLSGWGATKQKGTLEIRPIGDGPGIRINGEASAPLELFSLLNDEPDERGVIAAVPLPASLPLLLAGFGGFAVIRRRK